MHVRQVHRQALVFSGQGNQDLLALSPCAFLSSHQCPGAAIRAAIGKRRLTTELAGERNAWVTRLAGPIVVAHASPAGRLAALCDALSSQGRSVQRLS